MYGLNQKIRFLILVAYILVLLFISFILFGSVIPPTSEKGLWFYSCLASIILGDLLVSPYFNKPSDAVANTVAAIIVLLSVNAITIGLPEFSKYLWSLALGFNAFVLLNSVINIAAKDSGRNWLNRIANSSYVISSELGTPRWVFSTIIIYSLVSFHASHPKEYVWISFAWFALIAFHPIEYSIHLFLRIKYIWSEFLPQVTGDIIGYQFPSVILIKQRSDVNICFGDTLIVRGDRGENAIAVALDQIGFTDNLWQRALSISCTGLQHLVSAYNWEKTSVISISSADTARYPELTRICTEIRQTLVGIVAPETDIAKLRIELVRFDLEIEEGRLVQVDIGENKVLYQVVNGLTKEEVVEQKNSRGYVRGEARKMGKWNGDFFEPVKWVPQPNTPIFLVNVSTPEFNPEAIGHIPHTEYFVKIDMNYLITHNTAVLGILGVGKTCLALELIERMIHDQVKVVCFDLTNQYTEELAPYYHAEQEIENINRLNEIGRQGRDQVRQNVEEGGSIVNFKTEIANQLLTFFNPESTECVRIYNPTQFEVWRQDNKPYQGRASMASLTPCEITRIFSEVCLEILQAQGMSPYKAKCCLVFEESHSLVPEWNSISNEGDRAATNGTAKAILQGRKYGLGCLIVTQRTANVTKSILNQCNTIFALRSYDATGVEFLKNFIGDDYSGILTTLQDRHAIVFGKASSCQTPVLVRLNDRGDFVRDFRNSPDQNGINQAAEEF